MGLDVLVLVVKHNNLLAGDEESVYGLIHEKAVLDVNLELVVLLDHAELNEIVDVPLEGADHELIAAVYLVRQLLLVLEYAIDPFQPVPLRQAANEQLRLLVEEQKTRVLAQHPAGADAAVGALLHLLQKLLVAAVARLAQLLDGVSEVAGVEQPLQYAQVLQIVGQALAHVRRDGGPELLARPADVPDDVRLLPAAGAELRFLLHLDHLDALVDQVVVELVLAEELDQLLHQVDVDAVLAVPAQGARLGAEVGRLRGVVADHLLDGLRAVERRALVLVRAEVVELRVPEPPLGPQQEPVPLRVLGHLVAVALAIQRVNENAVDVLLEVAQRQVEDGRGLDIVWRVVNVQYLVRQHQELEAPHLRVFWRKGLVQVVVANLPRRVYIYPAGLFAQRARLDARGGPLHVVNINRALDLLLPQVDDDREELLLLLLPHFQHEQLVGDEHLEDVLLGVFNVLDFVVLVALRDHLWLLLAVRAGVVDNDHLIHHEVNLRLIRPKNAALVDDLAVIAVEDDLAVVLLYLKLQLLVHPLVQDIKRAVGGLDHVLRNQVLVEVVRLAREVLLQRLELPHPVVDCGHGRRELRVLAVRPVTVVCHVVLQNDNVVAHVSETNLDGVVQVNQLLSAPHGEDLLLADT